MTREVPAVKIGQQTLMGLNLRTHLIELIDRDYGELLVHPLAPTSETNRNQAFKCGMQINAEFFFNAVQATLDWARELRPDVGDQFLLYLSRYGQKWNFERGQYSPLALFDALQVKKDGKYRFPVPPQAAVDIAYTIYSPKAVSDDFAIPVVRISGPCKDDW